MTLSIMSTNHMIKIPLIHSLSISNVIDFRVIQESLNNKIVPPVHMGIITNLLYDMTTKSTIHPFKFSPNMRTSFSFWLDILFALDFLYYNEKFFRHLSLWPANVTQVAWASHWLYTYEAYTNKYNHWFVWFFTVAFVITSFKISLSLYNSLINR